MHVHPEKCTRTYIETGQTDKKERDNTRRYAGTHIKLTPVNKSHAKHIQMKLTALPDTATNNSPCWVVCRHVDPEAWGRECRACQIRAMHGETGKKAEQRSNLKADVAHRSHADLSNVWILARQVLHLHSHRKA